MLACMYVFLIHSIRFYIQKQTDLRTTPDLILLHVHTLLHTHYTTLSDTVAGEGVASFIP